MGMKTLLALDILQCSPLGAGFLPSKWQQPPAKAVEMSDGENKQEFQMEQLEEKHDKDGNGKTSDSHLIGSPMSGIGTLYLWLPNPLPVQALVQSSIPEEVLHYHGRDTSQKQHPLILLEQVKAEKGEEIE